MENGIGYGKKGESSRPHNHNQSAMKRFAGRVLVAGMLSSCSSFVSGSNGTCVVTPTAVLNCGESHREVLNLVNGVGTRLAVVLQPNGTIVGIQFEGLEFHGDVADRDAILNIQDVSCNTTGRDHVGAGRTLNRSDASPYSITVNSVAPHYSLNGAQWVDLTVTNDCRSDASVADASGDGAAEVQDASDTSSDATSPSCGWMPGGALSCGQNTRVTLHDSASISFGQIVLRLEDIQTGTPARALLTEYDHLCNVIGTPAVRQGESRTYYYNGDSLTINGDQVRAGYTFGDQFATLVITRNCGVTPPSNEVDAGVGCRFLNRGMLNQGESLHFSPPVPGPDTILLTDLEVERSSGNATALYNVTQSATGLIMDAFGVAENMTLRRSLTGSSQYVLAMTTGDVQAGYRFGVRRADTAVSVCSVQSDGGAVSDAGSD